MTVYLEAWLGGLLGSLIGCLGAILASRAAYDYLKYKRRQHRRTKRLRQELGQ